MNTALWGEWNSPGEDVVSELLPAASERAPERSSGLGEGGGARGEF